MFNYASAHYQWNCRAHEKPAEPELKPCPKCGGSAELCRGMTDSHVRCKACGIYLFARTDKDCRGYWNALPRGAGA